MRSAGALRLALVAGVVLSCVSCDQVTKSIARASLAASPPISLLSGFVHLELAHNRGAFLSLGEGLPDGLRYLLFVVLVSAALVLTLVFALRLQVNGSLPLVALSLLAGGGLGNLIDRLAHGGAVVDFISVGFGPLRSGVFNLADAAITSGVLLLLVTARNSPLFPKPEDQI
ncbi:MAG TPA: signal peptidase II [Thermoanaerobaculia bacterium]|nr:signal peptidase II [Thermoanaerobaculia bacterium]